MIQHHTRSRLAFKGVGCALAIGLLLWCASGCDDNDDFDYVPASGHGAIIVDNLTPDDVDVYVDGTFQGEVSDNHDRPFELEPGVHRVVLDGDNHRSYANDIDVLANRLTVLHVTLPGYYSARYDVSVDFQ